MTTTLNPDKMRNILHQIREALITAENDEEDPVTLFPQLIHDIRELVTEGLTHEPSNRESVGLDPLPPKE